MKLNYGILKRYAAIYKVPPKYIVTLGEGQTSLVEAPRLAKHIGFSGQIFLKLESQNPTGSFKDRGMTCAVSRAVAKKSKILICASTGNTSASASAYAARAGLKSVVLIPYGKIAMGKLAQALHYGAQVLQIKGNFDLALKLVQELASPQQLTLVNSTNPDRIDGQMSAAFEIVDELKRAPSHHFLPVGNAGNISAYWQGYKLYYQNKNLSTLPQMMGFQACGADPIVQNKVIKNPSTLASAIRIGNPASWQKAVLACRESKGIIQNVTDDEILIAQKLLTTLEGVFCEPASAASVAGLIKLNQNKKFAKTSLVVCTLTGHGLKDPQVGLENITKPLLVEAKLAMLKQYIL